MKNYHFNKVLITLAPSPRRGRGERLLIMMYIKPAMEIEKAQVANMLAESLPINDDTKVDGGTALTKESDWDDWSDDED